MPPDEVVRISQRSGSSPVWAWPPPMATPRRATTGTALIASVLNIIGFLLSFMVAAGKSQELFPAGSLRPAACGQGQTWTKAATLPAPDWEALAAQPLPTCTPAATLPAPSCVRMAVWFAPNWPMPAWLKAPSW